MKTSAIITVYNRPGILTACLRALAVQSRPIDEVVVSDDGSNDLSVQQMQASFPEFAFPIIYVRQDDQGYRLAAARNNAIRQATGDYLISLDCDILLLPDTVEMHCRRARPGWFLAGNRAWVNRATTNIMVTQLFGARALEVAWETADRHHISKAHRQFVRNQWLRALGLARRHKPKLLGCHFSLFKEDAQRVNGFDEAFVGWGFEDIDFALRLHQAGLRGHSLIREARALHLWHPSANSKPIQLSESPNWSYFHRREVPTFCTKGLA